MSRKTEKKPTFKRLIYGRALLVIAALLLQIGLLFSMWLSILEKIPLVTGSVAVLTAVMLIIVLNTWDNPSIKLSWCVLIAIAPLFGTVVYLFFKLDIGHRALRKLMHRSEKSSRRYALDSTQSMDKLKQEDPQMFALARYLQDNGACVCANAQTRYFPLGEDMFAAMLSELEKAEKFIFLEYFSIAPGQMWDQILGVLQRKAAQGVEVRVLYDGGCSISYLPHNYPEKLASMGIQCKVFSPFRMFVSTHYNNRDHRKIMIIDGHTAFTGGINLLDRYINQEQVFGHWKDTGVMICGEGAVEFTRIFLQMWNYREKDPVYTPYLLPVSQQNTEGYVIPFGDGPHSNQRLGKMVYLNILNQAKDYVYIMTPYLILDNEMLTALTFAAARGVDVRLILPHIPDKKYAFFLAQSHYLDLLSAGVKIYEYTPGFVHAKVFLCDDLHAVVGTINLDYRSLYLHYECAAYLYGGTAIDEIKEDFCKTFESSQQITLETARKRGVFSRLAAAILKIAAPLM